MGVYIVYRADTVHAIPMTLINYTDPCANNKYKGATDRSSFAALKSSERRDRRALLIIPKAPCNIPLPIDLSISFFVKINHTRNRSNRCCSNNAAETRRGARDDRHAAYQFNRI